jgi:acyl-CoA thioester hydrolase
VPGDNERAAAAAFVARATVRVRYSETDAMGRVYNSHFFVYFEVGRVEYLLQCGIPYSYMEEQGIYMPVAETACRYLAPARFEDILTVETSVGTAGRARVRFNYAVKRGEVVVAEGYTVHAARGRDGRPIRIPEEWARRLHFPPLP